MAATFCAGKDGAVVLGVGSASDFMSFELNETQAVESVAAYGAAVYDPYRGSGTPHLQATVAAFAKYGAANTPAGFGSGTVSPGGAAATFTPGTGVSLAGSCVCAGIRLGHSRIRAAVPLTYDLHNSGDMTITWPVS